MLFLLCDYSYILFLNLFLYCFVLVLSFSLMSVKITISRALLNMIFCLTKVKEQRSVENNYT